MSRAAANHPLALDVHTDVSAQEPPLCAREAPKSLAHEEKKYSLLVAYPIFVVWARILLQQVLTVCATPPCVVDQVSGEDGGDVLSQAMSEAVDSLGGLVEVVLSPSMRCCSYCFIKGNW